MNTYFTNEHGHSYLFNMRRNHWTKIIASVTTNLQLICMQRYFKRVQIKCILIFFIETYFSAFLFQISLEICMDSHKFNMLYSYFRVELINVKTVLFLNHECCMFKKDHMYQKLSQKFKLIVNRIKIMFS